MSAVSSLTGSVRRWLGLAALALAATGAAVPVAAATSSDPAAAGAAGTGAAGLVRVVASFSILGDIVQQVGGEDVVVSTLVGPNGDAHGYEPTPSDARKLGDAQVLVINGLGFETWLPRLQQASGFSGRLVQASAGVTPRAFEEEHAHGDGHGHDHGAAIDATGAAQTHSQGHDHAGHDHGPTDPHAWQSLDNAAIYARNIGRTLAEVDPAHAAAYEARAQAYATRILALDATLKATFAALPAERRKVVTSHDAFGYFGDAYGVTFIPVAGLSTSAEPSAGDLVRIIEQVRKEKVAAVFIENISSPRLAEQIVRETGVKIGGTLYSDALSRPGEPAATYLDMFEWNARQLLEAMR